MPYTVPFKEFGPVEIFRISTVSDSTSATFNQHLSQILEDFERNQFKSSLYLGMFVRHVIGDEQLKVSSGSSANAVLVIRGETTGRIVRVPLHIEHSMVRNTEHVMLDIG